MRPRVFWGEDAARAIIEPDSPLAIAGVWVIFGSGLITLVGNGVRYLTSTLPQQIASEAAWSVRLSSAVPFALNLVAIVFFAALLFKATRNYLHYRAMDRAAKMEARSSERK